MTTLARALILTALCTPALAGVLHVPDDFATLGAALQAANDGDEIVVAPGTYAPSTNGETFPLLLNEDVTLRGAGIGESVLDAERTGSVIRVIGGAGVVRDFTLTGGDAFRGGGVQIEAGSPEVAHNLIWRNVALKRGSGINTDGTSTPWIHHNVVWENSDRDLEEGGDPHGIQAGESSQPLIEHNLVGRTDSNGMIAAESAVPTIRHNILVWNGIPGLRGRGICNFGAPGTTIHHNLFFENEVAALVMFVDGVLTDIDGAGANAIDGGDLIYGNLDGDPLLADPDAMDFALTSGSPAIDAGDPTLGTDPDGSVLDLGPLPFVVVTSAPPLAGFELVGARPNPFNPRTQIEFTLESAGRVELRIVDARGRAVRTLTSARFDAGRHAVLWDGSDDDGRSAASGVYRAVLRGAEGSISRPLVLVR